MKKTREELLEMTLADTEHDEEGEVEYYVQTTEKCRVPLEIMLEDDEQLIQDWIYEHVNDQVESLGSYSY